MRQFIYCEIKSLLNYNASHPVLEKGWPPSWPAFSCEGWTHGLKFTENRHSKKIKGCCNVFESFSEEKKTRGYEYAHYFDFEWRANYCISKNWRLFPVIIFPQVLAQNRGSATSIENEDPELANKVNRRTAQIRRGSDEPPFTPRVSATCRNGQMIIKVETQFNFAGVVHARDYRKPECSGYGENSKVTFLRINLLAKKGEKEHCGVFYTKVNHLLLKFSQQ